MDAARATTAVDPPRLHAEDRAAAAPRVVAPDSFYARIGKPTIDRVVASVLLVLLAPVLVVIGVAVGIGIGWPV